jgi:hypothetical protein
VISTSPELKKEKGKNEKGITKTTYELFGNEKESRWSTAALITIG